MEQVPNALPSYDYNFSPKAPLPESQTPSLSVDSLQHAKESSAMGMPSCFLSFGVTHYLRIR